MSSELPSFATFPEDTIWQTWLADEDSERFLQSWLSLAGAYLSLSDDSYKSALERDESISQFLISFVHGQASRPSLLGDSHVARQLKRACFALTTRSLWLSSVASSSLLQWDFVSDFCLAYGRQKVSRVLTDLPAPVDGLLESSLLDLKRALVKDFQDLQIRGAENAKDRLKRASCLIAAWPRAGGIFLAGSDYFDSAVECFDVADEHLRRRIMVNVYLSLLGMTRCKPPNYALLTDLLYSLRHTASSHNAHKISVHGDSLVVSLVSNTPLLEQIQFRSAQLGQDGQRMTNILRELANLRRSSPLPPRRRTFAAKGKAKANVTETHGDKTSALQVHHLSQISQIQDLFPDLGSAFVAALLDEYKNNSEAVISHLLEQTLPPHLQAADHKENLLSVASPAINDEVRGDRSMSAREEHQRDVHDALDTLTVETSKLHFGKQEQLITADDMLNDRSEIPRKAAILAALAAFDSDEDERDDTYDVADVGGAVDSNGASGEDLEEATEHVLFTAYQTMPDVFGRDPAMRRGEARKRLKDETGMTDEMIEGWGLMLSRNPRRQQSLAAKMDAFTGQQPGLTSTAWRGNQQDESDSGSGTTGGRNGLPPRGRGRGQGRGRGRGRGTGGGSGGSDTVSGVAGPSGEKETEHARRQKEARKSSRANHNRRDQRAKKMARGFPV